MKKNQKSSNSIKVYSSGILDKNLKIKNAAWAFVIIKDGIEYVVSEKTFDSNEINIEIRALNHALDNLLEKELNNRKIDIYIFNYELLNIIKTLRVIEINKLKMSFTSKNSNAVLKLKRLLTFFSDVSFFFKIDSDERLELILKRTIRM